MRPEPSHRIDPRAIRLWQIHGLVQLVLLTVMVASVLGTLLLSSTLPVWTAALAIVPLLVYGILAVGVFPAVRWKVWRYELDEHELDLQHGLWVVHRTLVPLVRVQHVDTVQGPIAKLFRLSAVTVSTAAGTHEIPSLSDDVADQLRDRISAMARQAREQL
jgi:membrane protein YdbS with pleckstrin-like domain